MGETIGVNDKADQLAEEFERINKQAFRMALSVHKNPSLRSQLADEAGNLLKRLREIAGELERNHPDTAKQWFHPISESILDLHFVMADSGTTSLRLGDIIKWGK